jgi:hypothetical protein
MRDAKLVLALLTAVAMACGRSSADGPSETGSRACVACHQSDYEGVTRPVHVGVKPTTCADCHDETAWHPAHPGTDAGGAHPEERFPISSGNHADVTCAGCHSEPGATSKRNTSCVQCHSRARFDPKHRRVTAYPSADAPPSFCVDCHTRGTRAHG